MANKKISELVEETNPSSNDELIFLDSSTADLKKVKLKNLTASDELNDIDFPFTVLGTTGESSVLNLSSISASAYSSNTNIKSVHIGSNVKTIADSGFNLSALSSLTFSDGVTSIGKRAFYNQQGATFDETIELPDSLTSIGAFAFSQNTMKGGIKFGQNLTTIRSSAFYNCNGLNRVDIPDSVTQAGGAFGYSSISACKIGTGLSLQGIREMFDACNALTGVEVAENNPDASSFSGILFNKNQTSLRFAPRAVGKAIIPGTCTGIDSLAFYRSILTELSFPDSLTGIGSMSFYYSQIPDVLNFSSNLKSIGSAAFGFCHGPVSLNVPAGSIEAGAFRYFGSLKNATLGTGVTSVGSSAFTYCPNLTGLFCRVPLTSIGTNAFNATSPNLVIHARASDSTWTAGTNLSIKGNTSVDVIKDL